MRTTAIKRMMLGALVAIASAGVGCATNPATGQRHLMFLSWEEEKALGAEASASMTAEFGGPVGDKAASGYVDEVGRSLLGGIEEGVPELDWEFTLLDSAVANAFALPGGKVYLSRGLAEKLSSEAEMAGVIGHEIGHVTARHGNRRISKQIGWNVALGLGAIAVGAADEDTAFRKYGQYAVPALAIGGNIVLLKYGRDEEFEADKLGIRYMTRAGYDPIGQRRVMETLGALSSGARPPEWLSTHPASSTRVDRIDSQLRGEYAYTQNNPEFVIRADAYESRMLDRLGQLGPPVHDSTPPPEAETAMAALGPPASWCAHCDDAPGAVVTD